METKITTLVMLKSK